MIEKIIGISIIWIVAFVFAYIFVKIVRWVPII